MPFPVDDDAMDDARAAFKDTLIEGHCLLMQNSPGQAPAVGGSVQQAPTPTIAATLACRVERGIGSEDRYAEQVQGRTPYTVYLEYFPDPADRPKLTQWIEVPDEGLKLDILDVSKGYDGAFNTELVTVEYREE